MIFPKKTDIVHDTKQQMKADKYQTPGPGSYDISLPMIRPNYEAIRKSNDVIILKVNHHGDSYNFRSEKHRFPDEKQKSPGPAKYGQFSLNLRNKKIVQRKHSQRYTDLIEFMYRDRSKIQPIPYYKVEYDSQYQQNLKKIKNSHRRHKPKQRYSNQSKQGTKNIRESELQSSIKSIVRIKSSSKLTINLQQRRQIKYTLIDDQKQTNQKKSSLNTIDFPEQSSKFKSTKRPLEKQENLLLHRATLYNRSMLGMLIAKQQNKKSSRLSNAGQQDSKQTLNVSTIDNFS